MNLRTGALAVLALALLGSPVHAAPKAKPKPCKQVLDKTKDLYMDFYAKRDPKENIVPDDDALDIASADIASNATTVTAVIRVVKYALPPTTSPMGSTYELWFRVPGGSDEFYLSGSNVPGAGASFAFGYREPAAVGVADGLATPTSLGTPTGVFDVAKSEIRISVPISMFGNRARFTKGGRFTGLVAYAIRGGTSRGLFTDEAKSTASYVHGTATCVAVGK